MIKMAFREDAIFFEQFHPLQSFLSMKKKRIFTAIGYVMIELHVLIREHSGFLPFLVLL
jgi:hypothetical protein